MSDEQAASTAEQATSDPTIEHVVGSENQEAIVDVGSTGAPEQVDAGSSPEPQELVGYQCIKAGCTFRTKLLSEMEEHADGSGHGGYEPEEPVQPELFSEKGEVTRYVKVPLPDEQLDEKRCELADLYQEALDIENRKKSAVATYNAELKDVDEQMQAIARVLKTPYTEQSVKCVWRVIEGENARGLYRVDTGEMIEKTALSQEDRALELAQAEAANAQAADGAASPPLPVTSEAADTAGFINERNSGRRKPKATRAEMSGTAEDPEDDTDDEQPEVDTEAATAIADEIREGDQPEGRTDPLAGELASVGNGRRVRKRKAGGN